MIFLYKNILKINNFEFFILEQILSLNKKNIINYDEKIYFY